MHDDGVIQATALPDVGMGQWVVGRLGAIHLKSCIREWKNNLDTIAGHRDVGD